MDGSIDFFLYVAYFYKYDIQNISKNRKDPVIIIT